MNRKQTFYDHTEFYQWIIQHSFTQVTDANVQRYYSLFLKEERCRLGDCAGCAGFKSHYISEDVIVSGLIPNTRCSKSMVQQQARDIGVIQQRFRVPKKYENTYLDTLDRVTIGVKEQVITYIQNYPHNTPKGLYICSKENATGKTSIMWIIIRELIAAGRIESGYIFEPINKFIDLLREESMMADPVKPLLKKAQTCSLLMLDDMGKEKLTDFVVDKMFSIINERSNEVLPIIISSNIPLEAALWNSAYESALFARIMQNCVELNLS